MGLMLFLLLLLYSSWHARLALVIVHMDQIIGFCSKCHEKTRRRRTEMWITMCRFSLMEHQICYMELLSDCVCVCVCVSMWPIWLSENNFCLSLSLGPFSRFG